MGGIRAVSASYSVSERIFLWTAIHHPHFRDFMFYPCEPKYALHPKWSHEKDLHASACLGTWHIYKLDELSAAKSIAVETIVRYDVRIIY